MKIKKINEIIPAIREHVVMSDFTTWRVGGVADYFIETKNVQDLSRVVKLAIENKIPYFVLGNGSNILFSDYGFPGLVIKNSTENMAVLKEKSQIIADSGVMLSR
ncbi:MAG: murB, partial [Candidatus Berkelbacteria bacterium]|nr:murB [Candidatus Berkelbacteria bacterium]